MRRSQKPFSLRLSPDLVARVDECVERLRAYGLSVSRTDVTRMLIVRALDTTGGDLQKLLSTAPIPDETRG